MDDVTFRDGMRFVAPFMEKSARDLAFTTNSIIDSLAMECAESAATIALAREQVHELFEGPYMPTPETVMMALYPAGERLRERVSQVLTQRGIHSSTHTER